MRAAYDIEGFSALQRAEIAEIYRYLVTTGRKDRFSALQRAEIAEMYRERDRNTCSQ